MADTGEIFRAEARAGSSRMVALGFGNSRITAALFQGLRLEDRRCAAAADEDSRVELAAWLDSIGASVPKAAVSVNPPCDQAFCARWGGEILFLGRDREIPLRNLTTRPETTGHDRLLAAYAAWKLYGAPLLLVDVGTAVTFNLLNRQGDFLGGAIAPGIQLASAALGSRCAQLPRIDPLEGPAPLLGTDTASAMRSGLVNGHLSMIQGMVERFRRELCSDCRTVVTGGGAEPAVAVPGLFDFHDPDLLLKGIVLAYHRAS